VVQKKRTEGLPVRLERLTGLDSKSFNTISPAKAILTKLKDRITVIAKKIAADFLDIYIKISLSLKK
jgi:hypothetical protein